MLQWVIAWHDFVKSKNKMLIAFCFCFIVGAGVFSLLENNGSLFYLYLLLFIILFFVIIFWHKKYIRFLCLCLLFFILGACRFLISIPEKNFARVEFYNGEKKVLRGFVSSEPDIGLSDARYVVRVESVKEDQNSKSVSGNISVKTRIYPEYKYGDTLEIECLLQEPANFTTASAGSRLMAAKDSKFNYIKYLAKQGVWSICSNPNIKNLDENKGNILVSFMLKIKSKIKVQIASLWPEPNSSLMAGLLYGSRSGLPQELVDNFSRTGVSHIVAVSGYNVSIIAVALNIILIYAGLFRRQSFWFLISLILAFVFFTGATASVVRAGIMAIIILAAQHIGRMSAVGRALVYAAVVMLVLNPYLLVWDAGFQLSFLSTLGLVYLSPIIQYFVDSKFKIESNLWKSALEVFITTISAILVTLPLIMYQFGRFSVVAPLVNILILWIVPWLMLFGFISLVFSFIFFPVGQLVAWGTDLGVRYVIMVVDWFGSKSWSAFNLRISLPTMVVIYLVLILFIWRKKPKFYLQK